MTDAAVFVSSPQSALFVQDDGSVAAFIEQPAPVTVAFIGAGPPGPSGADAAQDMGAAISGGPFGGLVIDFPPLDHPATFGKAKFFSRSGVSGNLTCRLLQNDVLVGNVTLAPNPPPTLQRFAITAIVGAEDDVITFDVPADPQLTDLTFSIGSTP
jgi:hypothetical protein